jgi:NOL1/NOP2/fmu family ribosome biogenesis protein
MDRLKILNRKETDAVLDLVRQQWGAEIEIGHAMLRNTQNRIYLAGRDVFSIDMDRLNISSVGMYFGEIIREEHIRLSIEGSQLVGPSATKNVVELGDSEAREWLRGIDIDKKLDTKGFVIIRHRNKFGDDFLGCGKSMGDKILNYVPKARRVTSRD